MSVSIVIPAYNEAGVIEKVVRKYYTEVVARIHGAELIVVNDCSTDATPKIIEGLAQQMPQLKVINLKKNSGHSKALLAGFCLAKNNLIFHVDSDDQFLVDDFWELYRIAEDKDIVLGWRVSRKDSFLRKLVSLMVRLLNIAIFGAFIKDINCPFKFIKTRVLRDIIDDIPKSSFAISIPLLLVARQRGYSIAEVPVVHFARISGKSKFASISYLLKGCLLCCRDILLLRISLLRKKKLRCYPSNP